jgi:hypothetical protein
VLSIVSSPIVEIFPYRDEDVQSPAKKLQEVEEPASSQRGVVFSASGSDVEEEVDKEEPSNDSSLEDHFDEEHE